MLGVNSTSPSSTLPLTPATTRANYGLPQLSCMAHPINRRTWAFSTDETVPMAFTRGEGDTRCDVIMSTYHFVCRFEPAPWLILSGASSKSICNHGYLPPVAQRHLARREVDKTVHLLRKVHRKYRTRPLMNIYCRFRLTGENVGRKRTNEGATRRWRVDVPIRHLSACCVSQWLANTGWLRLTLSQYPKYIFVHGSGLAAGPLLWKFPTLAVSYNMGGRFSRWRSGSRHRTFNLRSPARSQNHHHHVLLCSTSFRTHQSSWLPNAQRISLQTCNMSQLGWAYGCDDAQLLTPMTAERYEEPATRARNRNWLVLATYDRRVLGLLFLAVLFSTPSHGCLEFIWVRNIWRKDMFTNWGFRCMYNRNRGYRSHLRISPRAQNVAFAFMVKVDCCVHLSMSYDNYHKGKRFPGCRHGSFH